MMTKKKYSLNLVFGLIDLALVLLIIFLPLRLIQRGTKTLVALRQTQFSFQRQEENFLKLNKDYRTNASEIKAIDTIFINPEAPVDFLAFLEEASQAEDLSLKVNPSLPQKSKKDVWASMVLQISAQGRPERFLRFLEKLENSPYLAEIYDFNLKKAPALAGAGAGGKGSVGEVEATFSLRAYIK
ncbi:MAG: hypothetical protein HY577_00220 [Candidatus Nealsonbacteria bacterium]|nr:hypothetical protein [Candidatus Nealsonbacteria bacterium]